MILYVNSCVRSQSRTNQLAQMALKNLSKSDGDIQEVNLQNERLQGLDWESLQERDKLIERGRFDDKFFSLPRQFAAADTIVVSAPYWDFLFPASLRTYFERVCVVGLTFSYDKDGRPVSLCRGKSLLYISTAGGMVGPKHMGYEYVKTIAKEFFGIKDSRLILAEGLDIQGADTKAIMSKAQAQIQGLTLCSPQS